MTSYPKQEVQGLLFSGYLRKRHATYLALRVLDRDAARTWVRELAGRICWGGDSKSAANVNVAVTESGLRQLGASEESLASFAPAFLEGMDAARRSRILGDIDDSAPENWLWGGPARRADVLLLLFAEDAASHAAQIDRETSAAQQGGLAVLKELRPAVLPERREDMREPFGFTDGLSQPYFDGAPGVEDLTPEARRLHCVPVGEFLLGYKNAYDEETSVPWLRSADETPRFGRNGSYLVIRQLEQDVAGFWKYFREKAVGAGPHEVERLAAKAIGRWRNGSPLSKHPDRPAQDFSADDPNDFAFRESDAAGDGCPLGAHIRRANPRDSFPGDREVILGQVNRHRLLRRGRAYGPSLEDPSQLLADDGRERGLFFACLNANIERQFEFVQHSWIDNPNFVGLRGEQDPVIGSQPDGRFSIQGLSVRERLRGIPRFVTTRGGAYLFMPGREGLRELGA